MNRENKTSESSTFFFFFFLFKANSLKIDWANKKKEEMAFKRSKLRKLHRAAANLAPPKKTHLTESWFRIYCSDN